MLGQRLQPRAYHPVARMMGNEQLSDALASLRGNIARAVDRMPTHDAFLQQKFAAPAEAAQ
jgi:tryptophan halogenase